jgi:predicted phage terminase large subunit-like protein
VLGIGPASSSASEQTTASRDRDRERRGFTPWLKAVSPELNWDFAHLEYVRKQLARVTRGELKKLLISWPPQHYKTWSTTVRYPLYRMLRNPGLRVGIGTYNQRYANKVSRWTSRIVDSLGLAYGDKQAVEEWNLSNGSSYIARGAGVGIAGEPVDLWICDDPFKNREEADSPAVQENVWEWHMDDITPRIQQGGAAVVIHARWNPGDLIGRILDSPDGPNWEYIRLPALAEENDPIGRAVGEALCRHAFNEESLADKERIMGIGFQGLYRLNPIPRGGTFFRRDWFGLPVDKTPAETTWVRYWDLASSRLDSACYTSGVLMGRHGKGADARFPVGDVIRGRWSPADRDDMILQTAIADRKRPGFDRTYFESPVFDKDGAARRGLIAKLAGHIIEADDVGGKGSKELRAEPVASAAKGGLVYLVAGSWNGAYLTELEGFPAGNYKDQVDSTSGAFNKLTTPDVTVSFNW